MGSGSQTSTTKTQIPKEIRERGTAITNGAMGSYFDPAQRYQPFSLGGTSGGGGGYTPIQQTQPQAAGGSPALNYWQSAAGAGSGGGAAAYPGGAPSQTTATGGGGGGFNVARQSQTPSYSYAPGTPGGGVGGQSPTNAGAQPSYAQIGDERTADLNSWHQQAGTGIDAAQSSYQPYFNNATGAATGAAQAYQPQGNVYASTGAQYGPNGQVSFAQYTPQTMAQFMSPFNQNVISTGMQELQRQHQLAQMGIDDQAAMSGAFGGGRHGVQAAETTRGFADMGQKFLSDSLQSSFNNAQNQYNTERNALFQQTGLNNQSNQQGFNQGLNYAQFLQGQGKDLQGAQLTGAKASTDLGNLALAQDQATRDNAYKAYEDARNYPLDVYERLAGINAMQPVNRTSTTTTSSGGGWLGPALYAGGQIGAAAIAASDERVKENVENVNPESVLSAFSKVAPKAYDYKEEVRARHPELTAPGRRIGFMAQDHERAFGQKAREVDGIKVVDIPDIMGKLVVAVNGLEKRTRHLAPKGKA